MCGHWRFSTASRRRNVHAVVSLHRLRGCRGDDLRDGAAGEKLPVCPRGGRRGPGEAAAPGVLQ